MTFLVFNRIHTGDGAVLRSTSETFRLAGYNLIYMAWEKRERPVDTGWHVTADELIRLHSQGRESYNTKCLVIDFHPNARERIGLVELLDIYAFTWSDGSGAPSWTPIMLRLRDVFYEEYDPPLDVDRKNEILAELNEPSSSEPDVFEFLYLNGPSLGWNWGKNGMTNAVFLHEAARDYFRKFF